MPVRSPFKLLLSVAALVSFGGCVAEGGKTDTLIVQQQPAKSPPAKAKTPTPTDTASENGTMNIRNPNFDTVNVEVRLGANTDCNQNSSFGSRQLRKGDVWTITTDQPVCWRRDLTPNAPTGQWTPWNRQTVTKGTTHEATL